MKKESRKKLEWGLLALAFILHLIGDGLKTRGLFISDSRFIRLLPYLPSLFICAGIVLWRFIELEIEGWKQKIQFKKNFGFWP